MTRFAIALLGYFVLVLRIDPAWNMLPTLVPAWLLIATQFLGPQVWPLAIGFGLALDGLSPTPFGSQLLLCTVATWGLLRLSESEWLSMFLPSLCTLGLLSVAVIGLEQVVLSGPNTLGPDMLGDVLFRAIAASLCGAVLITLSQLRLVRVPVGNPSSR